MENIIHSCSVQHQPGLFNQHIWPGNRTSANDLHGSPGSKNSSAKASVPSYVSDKEHDPGDIHNLIQGIHTIMDNIPSSMNIIFGQYTVNIRNNGRWTSMTISCSMGFHGYSSSKKLVHSELLEFVDLKSHAKGLQRNDMSVPQRTIQSAFDALDRPKRSTRAKVQLFQVILNLGAVRWWNMVKLRKTMRYSMNFDPRVTHLGRV